MQLIAFTILDTKTGIHHAPFFMPHAAAALRAIADVASDLSTVIGRHPADYTLLEVGVFSDDTGQLFAHAQFINHGNAAAILARARPVQAPLPMMDMPLG